MDILGQVAANPDNQTEVLRAHNWQKWKKEKRKYIPCMSLSESL